MLQLQPYVNHGRWVADCPNCNAGIFAPPGRGTVTCGNPLCGREYPVTHPPEKMVAAATLVLSARPEANQNWFPSRETVVDLKGENVARGVPLAPDPLATIDGVTPERVREILMAEREKGAIL